MLFVCIAVREIHETVSRQRARVLPLPDNVFQTQRVSGVAKIIWRSV